VKSRFGFERILHAAGSPLADTIAVARKIAGYDISVLITGESGTGKELLARAIHYNSRRADRGFVVQNCGALPDQLLESELFGCKKGAYTGAYEDRVGLFEQADGGTIFLDEIGETSPAFQVKLLRVLQEGEMRPLGARLTRKVDVRVIAATNRDLDAEAADLSFRRDLYYRLAAFRLHIPPLRERKMDLAPLAEHLLASTARAFGKAPSRFADGVLAQLAAHDWPGNVRELQNVVQRLVALADQPLVGAELAAALPARRPAGGQGSLRQQVEGLEEQVIQAALSRHGGNISRAAGELGLSRVGLRAKLQRYGLERLN
jgi:two-component system response regulator HupR/HoxA